MFKSFQKKPCHEARCILQYVEDSMQGKAANHVSVDYPIHVEVLEKFNKLFANEKQMSTASKELLRIAASISSFDVNMTHSAYKLIDFAKDMSTLSESNLAVVEETTASMNQVNETINNTSDTLKQLSDSSKVLVARNNESLHQLHEINGLKENVMSDATIMSKQIQQLVEMANRVNNIVNDVEAIAEQTNLLALNASIEAARAGEHGRGFSVVAQEIRKLADDTKTSLEDMKSFVHNIHSAAQDGKQSMDRTMNSTSEMSQKIDTITDTIDKNVNMLGTTIDNVQSIHHAMDGVKIAANEINQAMEVSSQDAEKLSHMTHIIHTDAMQSSEYAKQISQIDDTLSSIVKDMMASLKGGMNAINNEELIANITQAKISHEVWIKTLKKIVDEMKTYPLQTNSNKCAFGHFYHTIPLSHPSISGDWKAIDGIHAEFHTYGDKVLKAVKEKNAVKARENYMVAEKLSKEIFMYLDRVTAEIQQQTQKGVQLLRNYA